MLRCFGSHEFQVPKNSGTEVTQTAVRPIVNTGFKYPIHKCDENTRTGAHRGGLPRAFSKRTGCFQLSPDTVSKSFHFHLWFNLGTCVHAIVAPSSRALDPNTKYFRCSTIVLASFGCISSGELPQTCSKCRGVFNSSLPSCPHSRLSFPQVLSLLAVCSQIFSLLTVHSKYLYP